MLRGRMALPPEREPTCRRGCSRGFGALRAWVCAATGRAVRLVETHGEERGKPPFFAQPVGYDGRAFRIAQDHGCDTEKLLHEVCHWTVTPRERRGAVNYGLGPGASRVDPVTSDNEEVTVMLLEGLLAPRFGLDPACIARPDYNVHSRRNVDWDACRARAEAHYATIAASLRRAGAIATAVAK